MLAWLTAVLKKVAFLALALLCGVRWKTGEPRDERAVKTSRAVPRGEVRIIDHAHKVVGERHVGIWSYGTVYSALGLTRERFADWESRYGMDSLGVANDGSLLAPGFPVFSKVAWTYIDPVDLSDSETRELVSECERAIAQSKDTSASGVFRQIRDLALEAIQESATLRFGHP